MARQLTGLGECLTLPHHVPEGYRGDDEFDRTCGYPVVRFSTKIGSGAWYRDPWSRRLLVTTLLKEARRVDADYLIYNGWGGSPLFDASLTIAPRLLGIPAFLFVHARSRLPRTMSKLQSLTFGSLIRSAAGVITVCRVDAPALERFHVKPGRVHVVHNGVDLREVDSYLYSRNPNRFSRLDTALPIGQPNILCVARLHPDKRIDRLVRAMPRILASVPGARLAIAGIGDEEDRLRQLIGNSTAKDSIALLGLASGDMKLECYARSAVFALSSDNEGFPLVPLEAGAFGKPVVATSVGGVPEAVVSGESGLLVERDDDKALADAIVGLLIDPVEARRMGKNGRRRVESEYTWTRSAKKLRNVVHQAIESRL